MFVDLKKFTGIGVGAVMAMGTFGAVNTASADLFEFSGLLDPCAEVAGVNGGAGSGAACGVSPESGTVDVSYDDVTNLLEIDFEYTGLTGDFTNWHIHGPADADSNGAILLDAAVIWPGMGGDNPFSGAVTLTEDLFNIVGLTLVEGEAALLSGLFYINIHSVGFPTGELRSQLFNDVPEPATMALLGAGLLGVGAATRRRKTA